MLINDDRQFGSMKLANQASNRTQPHHARILVGIAKKFARQGVVFKKCTTLFVEKKLTFRSKYCKNDMTVNVIIFIRYWAHIARSARTRADSRPAPSVYGASVRRRGRWWRTCAPIRIGEVPTHASDDENDCVRLARKEHGDDELQVFSDELPANF